MEPMNTYMWMKMAAAAPRLAMMTSLKSTQPLKETIHIRKTLNLSIAFIVTFERKNFKECQHGVTNVVKVEPPRIHPNSGRNQARLGTSIVRKVHLCHENLSSETYHSYILHIVVLVNQNKWYDKTIPECSSTVGPVGDGVIVACGKSHAKHMNTVICKDKYEDDKQDRHKKYLFESFAELDYNTFHVGNLHNFPKTIRQVSKEE